MANFSLTAEPTFTAKVAIPVPGKKATNVEFTFKWRNGDDLKDLVDGLGNYKSDTDAILDMVSGWELKDVFDYENVEKMVKNYTGSASAIINKYLSENSGARVGN
jgi:hypothetical protein